MKHGASFAEKPSALPQAESWFEAAAGTTDGSGLAVEGAEGKKRVPWPEAAAFSTDASAFAEDLRR